MKTALLSVVFAATAFASITAQAEVRLTDGYCGRYEDQISNYYFKNVGDNDRNEGAPNEINLVLCSDRRTPYDRNLELVGGRCPSHYADNGLVTFQNVGNKDMNEGAINHIAVSLCEAGRPRGPYMVQGNCPSYQLSSVTFRNIGSEDVGEGADEWVTISLCR